MMKRTSLWGLALLPAMWTSAFAAPGELFQLTETGDNATIDIELCLKAKNEPISCQTYTLTHKQLSLLPSLNHTYSNAGIKVLTAGYRAASGCTMNANGNGFCLFTATPGQEVGITIANLDHYALGGTVTGLNEGTTLKLRTGLQEVSIDGNDATQPFTFPSPIEEGETYSVQVAAPIPLGQTCTVNNNSGTMGHQAVTNVAVICSDVTHTVGGTLSGLGSEKTVTLQNNNADEITLTANDTTFTFPIPVAENATYQVTVSHQPAGQLCTVNPSTPVQMGQSDVTDVAVTCADNMTSLSISQSELTLSVKNPTKNAALLGTSRVLTITNTGQMATTGLGVDSSGFPDDTSIDVSGCDGATLAPNGGNCQITITPGSIPSSNCSTGIAPTPTVLAVSADNVSTPVTSAVSIVDYGCIVQGGYLYAVDDTTPTSGSIGGKVLAQTDQAEALPNGVAWDADPACAIPPSYLCTQKTNAWDSYYGQNVANILGSTNPNNSSTNGPGNTYLISSVLNGNHGNTNTSPATYAAGRCIALAVNVQNQSCTVGQPGCYSDWYLPAICEMGPASNGSGCTAGTQNIVNNLALLRNNCVGSQCLSGYFWSSTEYAADPQGYAALESFASGGGSNQSTFNKLLKLGVRCSRALTL